MVPVNSAAVRSGLVRAEAEMVLASDFGSATPHARCPRHILEDRSA